MAERQGVVVPRGEDDGIDIVYTLPILQVDHGTIDPVDEGDVGDVLCPLAIPGRVRGVALRRHVHVGTVVRGLGVEVGACDQAGEVGPRCKRAYDEDGLAKVRFWRTVES